MNIEYKNILGSHYYLFQLNDNNIGHCIVSFNDNNTVTIEYLYIQPNYRGNNYSTEYYNILENIFRKSDYNYIKMSAHENTNKYNKLLTLYKSWGFSIIDQNNIIYQNNGDELIRIINLHKIIN